MTDEIKHIPTTNHVRKSVQGWMLLSLFRAIATDDEKKAFRACMEEDGYDPEIINLALGEEESNDNRQSNRQDRAGG